MRKHFYLISFQVTWKETHTTARLRFVSGIEASKATAPMERCHGTRRGDFFVFTFPMFLHFPCFLLRWSASIPWWCLLQRHLSLLTRSATCFVFNLTKCSIWKSLAKPLLLPPRISSLIFLSDFQHFWPRWQRQHWFQGVHAGHGNIREGVDRREGHQHKQNCRLCWNRYCSWFITNHHIAIINTRRKIFPIFLFFLRKNISYFPSQPHWQFLPVAVGLPNVWPGWIR